MAAELNLAKLRTKAALKGRYAKQLQRLQDEGIATASIEAAVAGTIKKLGVSKKSSIVIYGEPQSGKTEMMICLTAKLLDEGHPIIVHLLNDSVDLLTQNLRRFKSAALAPAAKTSSELQEDGPVPNELVVLCKKNSRDLQNLIGWLKGKTEIVVVDDEADYATPNSAINRGTKTTINAWVEQLIGAKGKYVGVTATPARLDLNNTFGNDTNRWVQFPAHSKYTGQDTFFPLDPKSVSYRLQRLTQGGTPEEAENALLRFLVTVAFLNTSQKPENYTMLVHTSGKKDDHETDRVSIDKTVATLLNTKEPAFALLAKKVFRVAQELYPKANAQTLTEYVVENASRTTPIVLNSKRDRKAAGDSATEPTSPFTIIIGGNIVSRGVTFPNLLSMFFTRNVTSKLQQDTYIQRARMFGARGKYLKHFELTIPTQLYDDWHKCFVYHKLALATIESNLGVPVWIADSRISVASSPSIDRGTVTLDKGEMAFGMFDYSTSLDRIIVDDPKSTATLEALRKKIGNDALPKFLIDYIDASLKKVPGTLAIHTGFSIAGYGTSAIQELISRKKGFMGKPQLEPTVFPQAQHHVKMFFNAAGKARVFYKYDGRLQFVQNLKNVNSR
jgi:hypothetical protein